MKNKRIITWLLAFLPLVITLIVLPILPDEIPAHSDFSGNVTRYGSKYESLIFPIIVVLFGFFWLLIEKISVKDKKYEQNMKVLFWSNIGTSLFFTAMTLWFLYLDFTQSENINFIVTDMNFKKIESVGISISCIILGIVLPKCKQNMLIGVRVIWTLRSENCWYKTHKFGGKLFLIGGIISTLLCLFVFNDSMAFYYAICTLVVIAIVLVIYSYCVFKKEKNNEINQL